ncbi:MAG: hypothetical protein FJX52_10675, partial [Alphaproteobacteria bacterium]|nr:hypothetical protein [Alphaproteobacteria bacterium]
MSPAPLFAVVVAGLIAVVPTFAQTMGHSRHGARPADPHAGHAMPAAAAPAHGGHDMSPVDVTNAPRAPVSARGGQELESQLVDGVRHFDLFTGLVRWTILPDIEVGAYAY